MIRALTTGDIVVFFEFLISIGTIIGIIWKFKNNIKKWLTGDLEASILRLELLNLIEHDPQNIDAIMYAYDDYVKYGKNTYIHSVFEKWKKEYFR